MKTHQKQGGKAGGGFYAEPGSIGIKVTFEELRRVRALYVTILIAQLIGGIAGFVFLDNDDWWARLAAGALLVYLPGFIFGLPVQAHFHPGTYSENRGLVIRIGCIACLGTAMGAFFL